MQYQVAPPRAGRMYLGRMPNIVEATTGGARQSHPPPRHSGGSFVFELCRLVRRCFLTVRPVQLDSPWVSSEYLRVQSELHRIGAGCAADRFTRRIEKDRQHSVEGGERETPPLAFCDVDEHGNRPAPTPPPPQRLSGGGRGGEGGARGDPRGCLCAPASWLRRQPLEVQIAV